MSSHQYDDLAQMLLISPMTSIEGLKHCDRRTFGPVPSKPNPRGRTANTSPAESTLLDLSNRLLRAWDGSLGPDGDDFMRRYCVTDFNMLNVSATIHESPFPDMVTLEEAIDEFRGKRMSSPKWRVNATIFSVDLDRPREYAVVWFTSAKSGSLPSAAGEWSTSREGVGKLWWHWNQIVKRWKCCQFECVHGSGGFCDLYSF